MMERVIKLSGRTVKKLNSLLAYLEEEWSKLNMNLSGDLIGR
jgi:hypothetical protein